MIYKIGDTIVRWHQLNIISFNCKDSLNCNLKAKFKLYCKGVNGKPDEPVVVHSRPKKWQPETFHAIRMSVYLYSWVLSCVRTNNKGAKAKN